MIFILNIIAIFLLILVAYQDYKYRAITWIILPVLFLVNFIATGYQNEFQTAMEYTLVNNLFIFIQFICIYGYLMLSGRNFRSVSRDYLGIGDMLYFTAITPAYNTVRFICYMVSGMILIMAGCIIWKYLKKKNLTRIRIPLAGLLAIYLVILKLGMMLFPESSIGEGIDLILFRAFT